MRKCVFAGSFDPMTIGHLDIIRKCSLLFDEVVVAVLININKRTLFSLEEREALARKATACFSNVRVRAYSGLAMDLMKDEKTEFYIRGIRNTNDYAYETLMDYANTDIHKELITIFIPTKQELLHISSSAVRDIIHFGGDYERYIPESIRGDVKDMISKKDK